MNSRFITVTGITLAAIVAAAAMAAPLANFLLPPSNHWLILAPKLAAAVIFTGSYLALAIGRIPGLAIDRAGIALAGAGLMVASGALPIADAYKAIDLDTITLLLGMMIVVANLRLSGFFAVATAWVGSRAHRPIALLAVIVASTGLLSAFLVNDAICLVMAPLVLELTLSLGLRPMPYLLAVAMASNIGSVATITGNPQNIMISSFSRISYPHFAAALGPIALAGLIITVALIGFRYRAEFARTAPLPEPASPPRAHPALMNRALLATVAMILLFFAGVAPAKAAIVIGGLLLLTRRLKSQRIYQEIDWPLLLMFGGLFIIVAGAQHALLTFGVVAAVGRIHLDQVPVLSLVTAVLSNLVSNVPAVLVLKPFVESLRNHDTAWLTVAMASTLAGNFTVLGSIANLIVVQKAGTAGVTISFWDYFKIGAPLTVITLVLGTLWLWR